MAETQTPPNHAESQTNGSPQEAPRPQGSFEYAGEQFAPLDPDRPIFPQLREVAAEHGNPDMVGLEWVEGNGMRYRVSSYAQLEQTRKVVKKGGLTVENRSITGPELTRKETVSKVPEMVDYRTVDVIDSEGNIVDILTFVGSHQEWIPRTIYGPFKATNTFYGRAIKPKEYKEVDNFEDHFSIGAIANPNAKGANVKVPRDVRGYRWVEEDQPQESRPGDTERVAAPVISNRNEADPFNPIKPADKIQELFEALALQQAGLRPGNKSGWRGLTWISVLNTRKKNHQTVDELVQMQVVRDVVINKKDPLSNQQYPERLFEVEHRRPDGSLAHREVLTLEDLQKHFIDRETHDRRRSEQREKARKIGEAPGLPPVPWNLHWALEASGQASAPSSSSAGLGKIAVHKRTPDKLDNARLHELTAEIEEIYEGLRTDLRRMGIEVADDDYINNTDGDAIRDSLRSWQSMNPKILEDSNRGRQLRLTATADIELGRRFRDALVQAFPVEARGPEAAEATEEENGRKVMYHHQFRPEVGNRMRALLFKNKIEGLLKAEKENKKKGFVLGPADLAAIGGMIRLSFGRV